MQAALGLQPRAFSRVLKAMVSGSGSALVRRVDRWHAGSCTSGLLRTVKACGPDRPNSNRVLKKADSRQAGGKKEQGVAGIRNIRSATPLHFRRRSRNGIVVQRV